MHFNIRSFIHSSFAVPHERKSDDGELRFFTEGNRLHSLASVINSVFLARSLLSSFSARPACVCSEINKLLMSWWWVKARSLKKKEQRSHMKFLLRSPLIHFIHTTRLRSAIDEKRNEWKKEIKFSTVSKQSTHTQQIMTERDGFTCWKFQCNAERETKRRWGSVGGCLRVG
jgi:hypothetical protein